MRTNYWHTFEEDRIYHIYNKSVTGLTLFKEHKDYVNFLEKYDKYFSEYLDIYAYCLIPNHFHLLVYLKPLGKIKIYLENENTKSANALLNEEISYDKFIIDQFKRFFSSVAITYKRKYEHQGAVFMERFKRVSPKNDAKRNYLVAYIHHNPIHHSLVKSYKAWKYSSFHEYSNKKSTMCNINRCIGWFGDFRKFNEFHEEFIYIPDN